MQVLPFWLRPSSTSLQVSALCAHLLVLAQRLLLTSQACSLFLIRLV